MCSVMLSVLLTYRLQFSTSSPTKSSDCSSDTSWQHLEQAQGHGNLVRLLLLQRPLTHILLALCDISSAYEAVTEGTFVYRTVTMLLMLQEAFNPWIHTYIM